MSKIQADIIHVLLPIRVRIWVSVLIRPSILVGIVRSWNFVVPNYVLASNLLFFFSELPAPRLKGLMHPHYEDYEHREGQKNHAC